MHLSRRLDLEGLEKVQLKTLTLWDGWIKSSKKKTYQNMVNFQVYKFLTFFFIVVMIFTHLFWLQKSKNDIIQLNDSRHSTDPNLDARLFTFFTGDTQTVVVVSALLPQKKTQSYFHHFLICLFLHLTCFHHYLRLSSSKRKFPIFNMLAFTRRLPGQ